MSLLVLPDHSSTIRVGFARLNWNNHQTTYEGYLLYVQKFRCVISTAATPDSSLPLILNHPQVIARRLTRLTPVNEPCVALMSDSSGMDWMLAYHGRPPWAWRELRPPQIWRWNGGWGGGPYADGPGLGVDPCAAEGEARGSHSSYPRPLNRVPDRHSDRPQAF